MTTKPKALIEAPVRTKKLIALSGAFLAFGWPILTGWYAGHLFYCGLASPTPCKDPGNFSDVIVLGPTVVGVFLLALSYVYIKKIDRSSKTLIVLTALAAGSFLAYWYIFVCFWIDLYLPSYLLSLGK